MAHLADHATHAGCILHLNNLGNLVKTQGDECFLLVYRSADTTLYLLDFYCCHFVYSLISR